MIAIKKWELWVLTFIILLGAFLRLHQLDSLPPAASYDPAYYGVDALRILDGEHPIYLSTNFGREVMFSYLVALLYSFLGPGSYGIHLAAAIVGILTIPATFLAAKVVMKHEQGQLGTILPPLSALLLAISYWHLNWSRFGVRAILVPLWVSLTVYALLRAIYVKQLRWYVWVGLLLGLSFYTYQAAWPLSALVLWGIISFAKRAAWRADGTKWLVAAIIAIGIASPLAFFAWNNPDLFFERAKQVVVTQDTSSFAEKIQTIAQQIQVSIAAFGIKGYHKPLLSIPYKPLLNPFLVILFLLGILSALWRWRQPYYLFWLVWLVVMFSPSFAAGQGSAAKRGIGALPAVMALISIGMLLPLQFINRAFEDKKQRWKDYVARLWVAFIILGLMGTMIMTYRDYFIVWGQDPQRLIDFQVDHSEVGRYIGQISPEETVFLSPLQPSHPSIRLNSNLHPNIRGYNGHFCIIYPTLSEHDFHYVFVPGETERSLANLSVHFPQGNLAATKVNPESDTPYYEAYYVPAGSIPTVNPANVTSVNWNDEITLLGFELDKAVYKPGEEIIVTLYYLAQQDVSQNYTAFVHLLDFSGETIEVRGQSDNEPCKGWVRTADWNKGDIVVDTVRVPVAPEIAPGDYVLATGFYTWPDLVRVPILQTAENASISNIAVLREISIIN